MQKPFFNFLRHVNLCVFTVDTWVLACSLTCCLILSLFYKAFIVVYLCCVFYILLEAVRLFLKDDV